MNHQDPSIIKTFVQITTVSSSYVYVLHTDGSLSVVIQFSDAHFYILAYCTDTNIVDFFIGSLS